MTVRASIPTRLILGVLLSTTSACPSAEDILEQEKLYSQHDEELIIRDFFRDRRNGYFLDVGCAFPKQYSTTYYLEQHLGWKGIGVDALPDYRESWEEQRPNSEFFAFFVDDHSDETKKFYRAGLRALSSGTKDRVFKGRSLHQIEIEVPTITLDKLLDLNGVTKIDFLSMDIEGSEPAALRGFDIERFKPELVCIEASKSIRTEIQAYFAAHGYERIDKYLDYDMVNWYYAPTH